MRPCGPRYQICWWILILQKHVTLTKWAPPLLHICLVNIPRFYFGFLSSDVQATVPYFGTHSKSCLSYQPVPAARLFFTRSQAPPSYHGDAAVTCQFHSGDAHQPVMAQNRMVGELCWKWERTTPSLWENEQLTRKTSQLYGNVAFVCFEPTGCCSWEWLLLQREILIHIVLVRPCVLATPNRRNHSSSFSSAGRQSFKLMSYCSVVYSVMCLDILGICDLKNPKLFELHCALSCACTVIITMKTPV